MLAYSVTCEGPLLIASHISLTLTMDSRFIFYHIFTSVWRYKALTSSMENPWAASIYQLAISMKLQPASSLGGYKDTRVYKEVCMKVCKKVNPLEHRAMKGHEAAWHRDLNLFLYVNLCASFSSAWNIIISTKEKNRNWCWRSYRRPSLQGAPSRRHTLTASSLNLLTCVAPHGPPINPNLTPLAFRSGLHKDRFPA